MTTMHERIHDAVNAHDAQRLASLFAENYRSAQPLHPSRGFGGSAQVLENWSSVFDGVPDFASELVASSVDGDVEWGEWRWHGHHVDGSPFAMRGVTIFVVRGGLVTEGRLYMEPVETDGADIDAAVQKLYKPSPGSSRFDDEDLTGAEFRECDLSRARLVGVVMQDAEIDGLVTNLVVNGVEVMSYVEAELDRRHPVRLLIRSDAPADLREAWRQLRVDWAAAVERVRSMPANSEHRGVDGEWSMVETLRHLVFVHDSWFRRCVLGVTESFTAMGLGPPFVMDREEDRLDPSAHPSLEEVLAVRNRQASEVETWLAGVTPDQLAQAAPVPDDGRWPPYAKGRTVRQCLGTVLDEEWAHHGFCIRDLDKLTDSKANGTLRGP